jgi:hypothetical protein
MFNLAIDSKLRGCDVAATAYEQTFAGLLARRLEIVVNRLSVCSVNSGRPVFRWRTVARGSA